MGSLWFLCVMALSILLAPLEVQAQSYRGTINGTVTDKTGAAIVGAHVQIIDENTKFVTAVVTNGSGLFSAPFLAPGTYDVKVDASGFTAAVQTGAVLIASDVKQVTFQLSPAGTTATVDVLTNVQLLQTESATLGQTLSPNEIENSPYIQDNPMMLATRVAGVYSNFTAGDETSNWRPVGGGMSGTTFSGVANLQLDEVDGIIDTPQEGNPNKAGYSGWIPPPNAIEEMHVSTAEYDAQYGETAGGVLSVVTKSGTQQFHGHAGFYFGDTIFTANTFNRNANVSNGVWSPLPRTTNNWREPSFSVTGPVQVPGHPFGNDKTYFMVAYEHATYNIPIAGPFVGSVPTLRERAGDFSELLTSNYLNCPAFGGTTSTACQGVIYDPTTTNLSTHARTSFAQENMARGATPVAAGCDPASTTFNCIPTARFTHPGGGANPVGQNLISYFPLPTGKGTSGAYVNNYQPANGVSDAEYYYSLAVRVDHEFNERNKLSASYFRSNILIDQPNEGFPYDSNGFSAGSAFAGTRIFNGGALEYTKVFSPTLVLNLRTGGLYAPFFQPRVGADFPLSNLGITGATATFPALGFPGTSESGPSGGYTGLQSGASVYDYSGVVNNSATLSKSLQRHTLRFGAEYNKFRDSVQSTKSNITSTPFAFTSQLTNASSTNTAVSNGGDGIASMLLGYPTSGQATIISPPTYDWHFIGGFVQDDWRVTKKLTLNLGFRWDYESPVTERHNYLNAGFDLGSVNPMNQGKACSAGTCSPPTTGVPQGYHGGLLFVSSANRSPFASELVDRWQPRASVSYQVWDNTVVHAGYAIFFAPNPTIGNNLGFTSNTTFANATSTSDVPNSCTAAQGGDAFGYCNMTNPFPNGFILPTGSSLGLSTSVGQAISYTDPQRAYPKANVWSVDVEQQLPFRMLLDVAYHGSLVNGLGITKNWNALPACYYLGGGCPNAGNSQALNGAVANPMAGYLPASSGLNNATIAQQNLYLLYPEFGAINDTITKVPGSGQRVGEVLYNAMLVTLNKQLSHGLEFRVNATVAHIEDRLYLLNPTDSVTSPAHTDDNQPNRYLEIVLMYSPPKINFQSRLLRGVVNGWGFNTAVQMQDQGFILNPSGAFSTGLSPVTHHKSLSHWFNTCYIPVVTQVSNTNPAPMYGPPTNCQFGEQPAWIQQPNLTPNQISTNQGMRGVRAQSIPYAQFNVVRGFPIYERLNGQFRMDVFNPFNWDLLGTGASNSLTSSQFGSNAFPLTQTNDARIIRFGVKVNF